MSKEGYSESIIKSLWGIFSKTIDNIVPAVTLLVLLCTFFTTFPLRAQQLPDFVADRALDPKALANAIRSAQNNEDPIATFDNGKTMMYHYVSFKNHLAYCILMRVEGDTPYVFHGFVERISSKELKLCFGCILNGRTQEFRRVRWDHDIAFNKITPTAIPAGKYYFGPALLHWDVEEHYDYENVNTAQGFVKQTNDFYGKNLSVTDYIAFDAGGRGHAIQNATAHHSEWYMGVTPRYGPRGGRRAPDEQDGYVEYDVSIDRTQPMTYKVDPATRRLTMKYGTTMTSKFKYDAPNHPVMIQIKASYTRWSKQAPRRFTTPDTFNYWGTFEDFIVISRVGSDINDPDSYIFVPKAGKMVQVEVSGEEVDYELGPVDLLGSSVDHYVEYINKNK